MSSMQIAIFLLRVIQYGFEAYQLMMVVYVLLSWFPGAWDSALGRILGSLVDPFLGLFRRFIPPLAGIDFSPIIAFFALDLLQRGVLEVFSRIVMAVLR